MLDKDYLRFRESGRHPIACTCFECNEGAARRAQPKTFSEWCWKCGHQENSHDENQCLVHYCSCEYGKDVQG